jgi:Zn-dependent peptidase ImmA (M78 family)
MSQSNQLWEFILEQDLGHMTQTKLKEKIGLGSHATFDAIRKGRKLKNETYQKIADYYRLPLEEILFKADIIKVRRQADPDKHIALIAAQLKEIKERDESWYNAIASVVQTMIAQKATN